MRPQDCRGGCRCRSCLLFKRALGVLAGGVNSPVRAFKAVGGTPRFIRSGAGARLVDADGRRYVDFCLSWGPLILGHAHPAVVRAAKRALESGASFGAPAEIEILLAEEMRRAMPSLERVRLVSSGTEAVMSAVRLARGHTGRDLVVTFAGEYHGHSDGLLIRTSGSGLASFGLPGSAGVPAAWAAKTISVPYNDAAAAVRAFSRHGGRIAAVLVEPVAGNMGLVPPRTGFLRSLRSLCSKYGALLIFDEVISGFRVGLGGAQERYGVRPDLTTLGKIAGGGFPLAAYGGRRRIMEALAPTGPVYQAGTLSGNPVACAAGLATLRILRKDRPYRRLERMTRRLVAGLKAAADEAGVAVQIPTIASMYTIFFAKEPVVDYASALRADTKAYARFFHAMLQRGVYLPPAQFETAFLSTAHTERDIDRAVAAPRAAFKEAR